MNLKGICPNSLLKILFLSISCTQNGSWLHLHPFQFADHVWKKGLLLSPRNKDLCCWMKWRVHHPAMVFVRVCAKHTLVYMVWTLVWHLDPIHLKWKHPYDLAWSCTWPLCITYDNMIPPASSKLFGQGNPCGHYLFKPYSAGDHRSLQAKTVTLGSTRNSPLTLHVKLSCEKKKKTTSCKGL